MSDSRIKLSHKEEFDQRGWTIVNLGFTDKEIFKYQKSLKQIRFKAVNLPIAPRRVYYDHLFKFNVAAVELPFNAAFIDNNIEEMFAKAKLGSLVRSLMSWDITTCNLSRLFCMENYNYRGRWHRDYQQTTNIQKPSSSHQLVLAAFYLFEQSGFRILKKEFDYGGKHSLIKTQQINSQICNYNMLLTPPKESYDVLHAKAGNVIFFNPLLLHQGTNYGSRLDYHLGFTNQILKSKSINYFQDFYVPEYFLKNYDYQSNIERLQLKSNGGPNISFDGRDTFFNRLINSINYRLPLLNILLQYKRFNSVFGRFKSSNFSWKKQYFSNSIWQKE